VTSEEEKNKALVRRFVEAQAEKDLAALEEVMAPDFVDHSVLPGQGTTREDYLQDVAEEQPASSDARLSIEDQMAEDDRVMTRLAIHGSHDQEMFTGVPPTGVELKFTGIMRGAKGQGMPLGIMAGVSYEHKEMVLDAGEAALFYSDGLVEAHDPEGEMFGFPRRAQRR
jgi:predicted ester cyclase